MPRIQKEALMYLNREYSIRALATMGLVVLIILLTAGSGWAAEGTEAPQKGKRPQAGKKATPKKETAKESGAKPLDCTGDFPKIQKIQPDEGKAGTKVTITGRNFGQRGCLSMVSFGPGSPAKFDQKDDTTITTTVPDAKKGMRLLTVNTAAGQDSKPFLVR